MNWGTVADWASAVGSVFAAAVALWLAKRERRVSIQAKCGIRVMVDGRQQTTLVSITVTNTGFRPFKISNIGLRHGLIKKQMGLIKLGQPTEFCDPLLITLSDGEGSHFGFPINHKNWVATMGQEMQSWLAVETLRVFICCSNGQVFKLRPERPLLNHFHNLRKSKKSDSPSKGNN
ncbi:hypothetical protein HP436_13080 [Pseudomonas sp. CrR14]|nr:hypothetical protein [Pseudomonas sp. CrR14]